MLELTPPTFEHFASEAEHGNVVPVVLTVLADLQTPVGAFLRNSAGAQYSFLLESVEGGERIARYSFIGANPWMVAQSRGATTVVTERGTTRNVDRNGLDFLRAHFADKKLAERTNLPPLVGGAVGYLAYNAAQWFEPVLAVDGAQSPTHDAAWMFFRNIIAFDRVRQQMEITSVVFTDEAVGNRAKLRELYESAVAETKQIADRLVIASATEADKKTQEAASAVFQSNWPREDFEAAVEKVKEHIAAGDCYQVVIAQQFTKRTNASPLAIYRALRAVNPSPYMFFLRIGEETIIGASPEMLVRCHDRQLEYRPIAGTRRRGASEAEDEALANEMRKDEKEVAEHTMLVDLGRNDLGRVSDYGSVEVAELMIVERYSHVQHLVSKLRSTLRSDLNRFDALAACFPAGTVSGAPKIRAMQIIRELEPSPRGIYAGAVLYADYANNLDSCIAIRTIHLRDGVATVQSGGGIVADSVPAEEFEESMNKARAMFRAIEMAEHGL